MFKSNYNLFRERETPFDKGTQNKYIWSKDKVWEEYTEGNFCIYRIRNECVWTKAKADSNKQIKNKVLFSFLRKVNKRSNARRHTHTHRILVFFVLSLRTICKLSWCFLLPVVQQSSSCPPWRASRGNGNSTGQMRTAFSMPLRSTSIFSMTYTVFNTTLSRPRSWDFKSIGRQQHRFTIQDHITRIKCFLKAIKMYSKPSPVEIWDLMGKLSFALGSG